MDVKNHGLAVRLRAIGMIQAGMTQKKVATELHVSLRSIERWWKADKLGKSQETKPRCGRPKLRCGRPKITFNTCMFQFPL